MSKTREAQIYTIIIIFNILFLGFFGVWRTAGNLTKKHTYKNTLGEYLTKLNTTLEEIDGLEDTLEKAKIYVTRLDKLIPSEPDMENYLIEFIAAASENRLTVEHMDIQKSSDPYRLTLTVSLTGKDVNLVNFIDRIENMDRLATVYRVDIAKIKETKDPTLHMLMEIYHGTGGEEL